MYDTENSLKVITKGAVIVLIGILISKILSYGYRILIARIGPEDYGTFSIALAVLGFISTISLLGLNNGVLRYVPHYMALSKSEIAKKIIFFSLAVTFTVGLIFSIILFLFSQEISISIFHNYELVPILKVIAIIIPFYVINNIFFFAFRAFKQIKYEVYLKNIFENVNKLILTFLVIYVMGKGILGVSVAYVIPIFLTTIISFYILKKIIPKKTKSFEIFSKKEFLFYSIPLLFSTFLIMLLSWTDTLMLGYFTSPSEVGIYNTALPTAQLLYVMPYAISVLFIPLLSEHFAKEKKESFKEIYKISSKWILLTNIFIFSLFILFSKEILGYLFGQEYIIGSTMFIIISAGFFINYTLINSEEILKVIKKTKVLFWNSAIVAIINVFLNLLLIPQYGGIGAAIATSFSFLLMVLMIVTESIYFLKITPFSLRWVSIIFSAVVSTLTIFYVKTLFFNDITIVSMIFLGILLLIIYFILLYISKSFQQEDFFILRSIKQKVKASLGF